MSDFASEKHLPNNQLNDSFSFAQELSDGIGSDDDFGDFEEVDQENPETTIPTGPIIKSDIKPYSGSYLEEKSCIDGLVNGIFGASETKKLVDEECKFEFDERSEKIFQRLVGDDTYSATGFIWKRSVIYKQLLLNLDIQENDMSMVKRVSISAGTGDSEFKNMYQLEKMIESDQEIVSLLNQVPEFESLGIAATSDEYHSLIEQTQNTLRSAKQALSANDVNLNELTELKSKLLKLMSVWDNETRETKADNELFTSYVENLIGNTQKIRREKRILQTKSQSKSRSKGFRK